MTNDILSSGISFLPKVARPEVIILKGASFYPKTRSDLGLIYAQTGSCEVVLEDSTVALSTGETMILRENDLKEIRAERVHGVYYGFSSKYEDEILPYLRLKTNEIYYIGNHHDVNTASDIMFVETNEVEPHWLTVCAASFIKVLCYISRSAVYIPTKDRNKDFEKISPAVVAIHSGRSNDNGIEEYAKMCNMSTSYFSHIFTKIIGMPPMEYKRKKRLDLAKELLAGSMLTAKEIAIIVGFKDSLYFSRCFKQDTGFTPSEYREKVKNREII